MTSNHIETIANYKKTLDRIKEMIVTDKFPDGLAGDLIMQSLMENHEVLLARIAELEN